MPLMPVAKDRCYKEIPRLGDCYSDNSSGVVITVIPDDSHDLRTLSKSMMLSEPRYNIGFSFLSWAIVSSCFIGDSICLPVANQKSLSHTQKSSSLCVAIACLFVMIMSSTISKCFSIEFR